MTSAVSALSMHSVEYVLGYALYANVPELSPVQVLQITLFRQHFDFTAMRGYK